MDGEKVDGQKRHPEDRIKVVQQELQALHDQTAAAIARGGAWEHGTQTHRVLLLREIDECLLKVLQWRWQG